MITYEVKFDRNADMMCILPSDAYCWGESVDLDDKHETYHYYAFTPADAARLENSLDGCSGCVSYRVIENA